MNNAQKTVIDRTVTIQRMVKEGVSTLRIREQMAALSNEVQLLHTVNYVKPNLAEERKKLEIALECRQEYVLRDRHERVVFSIKPDWTSFGVVRMGQYNDFISFGHEKFILAEFDRYTLRCDLE